MRKLFTFVMMCVLASSAWATDIVFDATTDTGTGSSTAAAFTLEKDGVKIAVSQGVANGSQYRFYKNQTVTVTSNVGPVSKVEFTCTANDDAQYGPGNFTVNTGDYSYSGKVGTWQGTETEIVFTASKAQVRATRVVVTVGEGGLASPTIRPASGTYYDPIQVSITCGTTGTKIYYTTNGSDPTTASTLYTAPFTLSSSATVKAISALDGETSGVVSAAYEFATATPVANIKAYQNTADGVTVKFTNPVKVLWQYNKYLYVMDETGYALFYGTTGQTYKNGDVIPAGFAGTKTTYAGECELNVISGFNPATSNTPIAPWTITAAQVSHNTFGQYVTFKGATITKVDDKNYTMTDADGNTCAIYFGSLGVSAPASLDATFTVNAIVGSYGADNVVYQLLPTYLRAEVEGGFGWGSMFNVADQTAVTFDHNSTVLFQKGSTMYMKDDTGYGIAYGTLSQTYSPGDIVPAGFGGVKTTYNTFPELQTLKGFNAPVGHVDLVAEQITPKQVGESYWAHYVVLKDVTISMTDANNGTATDASGNSCPIFNNTFKADVPTDGGTYTLYAIVAAYKGSGMQAPVFQLLPIKVEGYIGVPEDVRTLEDLYSIPSTKKGHFTEDLTVIFQADYRDLYVKDVDGNYGLVYGAVEGTFKNGDIIKDAVAGWTIYNTVIYEVIPYENFVVAGQGDKVQPESMPVEEVSQDMVHYYLSFEDVTLTATETADTYTLSDETGSLKLFNKFAENVTMPEIEAGKTYDVKAFVTVYKGEIELYPSEVTVHGAPVVLKGDVNGDGEVNISDVNAVIDIILGGGSNPAADVNGDGEVNIGDINAVIDIILG